jgi:hypothetical protein
MRVAFKFLVSNLFNFLNNLGTNESSIIFF